MFMHICVPTSQELILKACDHTWLYMFICKKNGQIQKNWSDAFAIFELPIDP